MGKKLIACPAWRSLAKTSFIRYTILTEKNLLCIKNQIEFSVRADGDALSFMKPMDIYLLFSNALDNAIERLQKEQIENRVVSLHIFPKGRHTVISLENYCSEPLHFQDGLPQTIKPDKAVHGFGMKSIRSIVEKYLSAYVEI